MKSDDLVTRLREVIGQESVRSFANRAGIPDSTLRSILAGREPGLATAAAIASAAGVTLDWLASGKGEPRPVPRLQGVSGGKNYPDESLVRDVIEYVEEYLQERSIVLPPSRKAELIVTACEILKDEETSNNKSKSTILRLVKLAGG